MREERRLKVYYLHKEYITPWDIRQYTYCPLIPWIIHHLGITEPPTESMEIGGEVNAEQKQEIAKKLKLPKPWRIEVWLEDRKLGLHGKIDILAGTKRLIVVEVKKYTRKGIEHYKNQLLAYALLATRKIAPVTKAILVLGNKTIQYPITHQDLKQAEKLVQKTRKTITSEQPPTTNQNPNKCKTCWYKKYCPHHNT